jgi:hypothetical protein
MGHNVGGSGIDVTNTGTNQWYLAVDRTNGQHWRRSVASVSRDSTNSDVDYAITALNEPWPAHLGTMKILRWTVATNKLTPTGPLPRFFNSQYSRTEQTGSGPGLPNSWTSYGPALIPGYTNLAYSFGAGTNISLNIIGYVAGEQIPTVCTNSVGMADGGDSGSPTYLVVSNSLVFLSGYGPTSAALGTNLSLFWQDVATVYDAAGFSTNDYPVEFETLEGWP